MILGSSGENVFPEDIEAELNKIETVRDSAVVGLDLNGKSVIHAVLLGEECDGDLILEKANATRERFVFDLCQNTVKYFV